MTGSSRPFSTASIRIVADELTSSNSPSIEAVLQKLLRIDGQIDADFKSLTRDLSQAHIEIAQARVELQKESAIRIQLQTRAEEQQSTIAALRDELKKTRDNHQTLQKKPLTPRKKDATSNRARPSKTVFGLCRCASGKENVCNGVGIDHEPGCELKKAVLAEMDSRSLCDILTAREEAYRAQTTLVERLKSDNRELKDTYEKLWERYQDVYNGRVVGEKPHRLSVDERIQHLSFRVQQAGQAACVVASQIGQRLQLTAQDVQSIRSTWGHSPDVAVDTRYTDAEESNQSDRFTTDTFAGSTTTEVSKGSSKHARSSTSAAVRDEYENDTFSMDSVRNENERFNVAGKELMRTLALQQEAHDRLRTTVVELTKELERIEPQNMEETKKYREELGMAQDQLKSVENELKKAKSELKEKAKEISNLKRQLKKVLAEYEAVSIAHSYSNAELSKIRAKTRHDRQTNDRPPLRGNAVNHGVENLLHHRRNHFR